MAQTLPPPREYAAWLAAFRIYMGLFWLIAGVLKIGSGSFVGSNGMMVRMVTNFAVKTHGAYHDFLVHTVLTHATLFGELVQWGETLAGLSLLLGLLTRAGGVVAAFLALNYWIARGAGASPEDYVGLEVLAAAASLVHAVLPTGRLFGLDGTLRARGR
ncbi:MAG: hypothetical protein KGM44_04155 [bacterium]|nr:hypothetical protein [bacterium]